MKGMVLGTVGVVGVGAAVVTGGGGGPDDFIGVVSKPPAAVYAAFSELSPAGDTTFPMMNKGGWNKRLTQRVVKVQNEQVKLELLVDNEALVTAEVQMAPDAGGTRVAAEFDFNGKLLNRLMKEEGGPPVPGFAFQDFMIDQVFAQAMSEMVNRIEEGQPLLSLADAHKRWGISDGGGSGRFQTQGHAAWEQHQAAAPQVSARPTLNPNLERRDVSGDAAGSYR